MAKVQLIRSVIDGNGKTYPAGTVFEEAEPTFNSQWIVTEGGVKFFVNCKDTEEVDGEN